MNNEIEILKQFFAAINRNDLPGITQYFDPEIVRIEPEGFPTGDHLSAPQRTAKTQQMQPSRLVA